MENQSSAESKRNGEVDYHRGRGHDQFQDTIEIVTLQEFSRLLNVSQPKKLHLGSQQRCQIQKVPPEVRLRTQQNAHVYDPMMFSLGPYHHGKPELRRAEEFKYHCLDWCCGGDEKRKAFFYNKVFEKIAVIRECYAEVTIVEKYDDKALALMMLLDACIIINSIYNDLDMKRNNFLEWQICLGAGSREFMVRDMIVLENQIPFEILKLLISLQYGKEEAEGFLPRFLSHKLQIDLNQPKIPTENEEPPLHVLEAFWSVITKKCNSELDRQIHNRLISKFRLPRFTMREEKNDENKFRWSGSSMREKKNNVLSYSCRSVMDLKAKGISIRPNSSQSLMDITFTSNAFYGQLQLPLLYSSDLCPVIFSNLIAYELSPNSNTTLIVLSYTVFMKSLIQSAEDVKELQQKGVLVNKFANLEKAVKLYKEIDTFGLHDEDIFMDVKQKIEEHCSSKAKTWIADLIHSRFRTPWTAIALFAAVSFLCLAFLQTLFTIHPGKSLTFCAVATYLVWKSRNKLLVEDVHPNPITIC